MTFNEPLERAISLHQNGLFNDAEVLYREALAIKPEEPDALFNLALIYIQNNQTESAYSLLIKTVELFPDFIEAQLQLGKIQVFLGDFQKGKKSFEKVLEVYPDLFEANLNIANCLIALGNNSEASKYFLKVIEKNTEIPLAHYNLGIFYQSENNFVKAEFHFKEAIRLNPEWSEAYNNLGNTLIELGKSKEALEAIYNAINYRPDWAEAYNNLANIYFEQNDFKKAKEYYRKTLELKPYFPPAYDCLFMSYLYDNDVKPEEWKKLVEESSVFYSGISSNYIFNNIPNPEKKLRIGYISPDLKNHSCIWFLLPLFENHNHKYFEIICFSNVKNTDSFTTQVKELSDRWFDIFSLDDSELFDLIRKEKVDILVDLAGHTSNNRLALCAKKPAPVQLTWLGFPGSTAVKAIDYRISDPSLTPDGQNDFFVEKIWNLNFISHCYTKPIDFPPVNELPFLKNGFITFASFNNLAKINYYIISIWSKLMLEIPHSKIIIKGKHTADPFQQNRIIDSFEKNGISEKRIKFLEWKNSNFDHMTSYNLVDISLDTFPYNGATTTLESLSMGVPVITLKGNNTSSRYGYSFLDSLGLNQFIADSDYQFIKIGKSISKDIKNLIGLRKGLREILINSPLCDSKAFTLEIESAYREIWKNWCKEKKN